MDPTPAMRIKFTAVMKVILRSKSNAVFKR